MYFSNNYLQKQKILIINHFHIYLSCYSPGRRPRTHNPAQHRPGRKQFTFFSSFFFIVGSSLLHSQALHKSTVIFFEVIWPIKITSRHKVMIHIFRLCNVHYLHQKDHKRNIRHLCKNVAAVIVAKESLCKDTNSLSQLNRYKINKEIMEKKTKIGWQEHIFRCEC